MQWATIMQCHHMVVVGSSSPSGDTHRHLHHLRIHHDPMRQIPGSQTHQAI